MIDLSYWYNKYIAIQLPGDERVFETKITWVHNLPPKTVELMRDGKVVTLTCYISSNLENISDVFLRESLPDYFRCGTPKCLLLNVSTGEWFIEDYTRTRIKITVTVVEKK